MIIEKDFVRVVIMLAQFHWGLGIIIDNNIIIIIIIIYNHRYY